MNANHTSSSTEGLPDWLSPPHPVGHSPVPRSANTHANVVALRNAQFENFFEVALESMKAGVQLDTLLQRDHRDIAGTNGDFKETRGRFVAWMMEDKHRADRFYEACKVAAEVMALDIIPIADGHDTLVIDGVALPADPKTTQMRINARFKLMDKWNRERYGDLVSKSAPVQVNVNMAAFGLAPDQLSQVSPETRAVIDHAYADTSLT